MTHKYQFHIAYHDKAHTAGSKAVQDCKSILAELGYQDCSIENLPLSPKILRLPRLLKMVYKFFLLIKPGSIIAIQYPLLSGNTMFHHFIKATKVKRTKFFCIVHDLDDLRYPDIATLASSDVQKLSHYDYVVVHNQKMKNWLVEKNLKVPVVVLEAFDYLSIVNEVSNIDPPTHLNQIVFAGNLSKSNFIYALDIVEGWDFNLYGPNYVPEKAFSVKNICWHGSFSPEEILTNMKGAFGLIWDGEYIDKLDEAYGNYLIYNSPHKLSLYLAAGLPVIAPAKSAISTFITDNGIGILIDSLIDLREFHIEPEAYQLMKKNVAHIAQKMKAGDFFAEAIHAIEADIFMSKPLVNLVSTTNTITI